MHLVGLLSSYFAHDARSQEPKASIYLYLFSSSVPVMVCYLDLVPYRTWLASQDCCNVWCCGKKNRRGVMLQKSCWKFYHILLTLQSSNNCPHNSFLTWLGLLALFVYRCVLMLSEEESHMAVCICRSGSEFCIICFAVLGTVWLSLGVCKFSKSLRNLGVLCVSMVLWNMSHTEVSQILGAAVQNEATWAMYARCGHLCQSDTVELAEMYERKWDQSVHIDSTCLVVAMVCFTAVTQLLMNGTNLY